MSDDMRPAGPAENTDAATAPARWLLDAAADGRVALTQTFALSRAVVRDAAERWPDWWDAELFGSPHREADMRVLEALHAGLRRLRLVRRRGRKLFATARGRELAADPAALIVELASDLGGGDAFTNTVANAVIDVLARAEWCEHDQLVGPALRAARRGGWRDPDGNPPDERDVSWVVGEVLCRGEAYGLIARRRDRSEPRRWHSLIALTPAGRAALGHERREGEHATTLVFDAELLSVRAEDVHGVSALLAVASHDHLTALHDAILDAFGLDDDHLYSFWLDGRFWGEPSTEFARPGMPDTDPPTADVLLAELDLEIGHRIAYVFDFGDEWRVALTLRERIDDDTGPSPRVVKRHGAPPPQYPPLDDE